MRTRADSAAAEADTAVPCRGYGAGDLAEAASVAARVLGNWAGVRCLVAHNRGEPAAAPDVVVEAIHPAYVRQLATRLGAPEAVRTTAGSVTWRSTAHGVDLFVYANHHPDDQGVDP